MLASGANVVTRRSKARSQFHIMPIVSAQRPLATALRTRCYVLTCVGPLAYVKSRHSYQKTRIRNIEVCGAIDKNKTTKWFRFTPSPPARHSLFWLGLPSPTAHIRSQSVSPRRLHPTNLQP